MLEPNEEMLREFFKSKMPKIFQPSAFYYVDLSLKQITIDYIVAPKQNLLSHVKMLLYPLYSLNFVL